MSPFLKVFESLMVSDFEVFSFSEGGAHLIQQGFQRFCAILSVVGSYENLAGAHLNLENLILLDFRTPAV